MVKACDTEKRACGPTTRFRQTSAERVPGLQAPVDVGGVVVQAHHVREFGPRLPQDGLDVVHRLLYLSAHVPGVQRASFRVDRDLPREDKPRRKPCDTWAYFSWRGFGSGKRVKARRYRLRGRAYPKYFRHRYSCYVSHT